MDKFFHSRFIGHPSNYVYDEYTTLLFFLYRISFDIYVSQGEGRFHYPRILDSLFLLSATLDPNHISSFPSNGVGTKKGDEDGEVLFSQSKVYRYMGQLVWRG